jgi:hypothetical protein
VVSPLCDCIGFKVSSMSNIIMIRIINIIIEMKSSVNRRP